MVFFMENRIYPDNIVIRLFEEKDEKKQHPKQFVLKRCIGTGANCVAYMAEGEDGIPVKLKQFRPAGLKKDGEQYRQAERRFVQAYDQQRSMMKDERTAAVTAGLYGLYRDDTEFCWTSVSAMVGRTLETILPDCSLQKNLDIIRKVAESIKAYHDAGWVLLDVKPENILVIDSLGLHGVNFFDFDSFVRLSDIQEAIRKGQTLMLSSSEAYSAPELLEHEVNLREIGITVDFYSVGALLFTALFSRPPELYDCLPDSEYDYALVNGKEFLSSEIKTEISRFLHHTLSMSSEGRYSSDDELLSALDRILELSALSVPRLSKVLPHAVSTFCGREREIDMVSSAIRASTTPLYLSGIGGIGKTQLALKVAEELREEFDFFYIPFNNSVKETILSLPMENLILERVDESGVSVAASEEERYQKILSSLRSGYKSNTVLIIDNFDASRDEDTPSIRYDPDFNVLETLPLRLLFTSRCCFEGVRTVQIENMEDEAILRLLSSGFPGQKQETLLQIADAVERHTLTLSILSGMAKESKGRMTAAKILEELSGEPEQNTVISQLRKAFKASNMSKTARSVMACACLFPQRGLSSEILVSLLTPEQWSKASQLERSGWLRFDQFSSLWTIHPIAKAVCLAEKSTKINWENSGRFISELQKAYRRDYYKDAGAETRAQLDELFSNIGKYSITKPFPWRASAVFAISMALLLLPLFRFYTKENSPVLTMQLYPAENISDEAVSHDYSIIRERFKKLGIQNIFVDEEMGTLNGRAHLSVLGKQNNLEEMLHNIIKYPGSLFVIGSGRYSWEYEEIDREHIVVASVRNGSIPGLSEAQRENANLYITGDFPYLYLQFDEDAGKRLDSFSERIEDALTFAFDFDQTDDYLKFAYACPGEEENSYYLLGDSWGNETVYNALALSLMQEPLSCEYQIVTTLDPSAVWQDPKSLTPDAVGKYQKQIKEIGERSVTFYYERYSPETISDYTFDKSLLEIKKRLDILKIPYAIGTDYWGYRKIAVCMQADKLSYDIIFSILPGTSVWIRPSYKHGDLSLGYQSDFKAEVIQKNDGSYALQLTGKDKQLHNQIRETTAAMVRDRDHRIFLTYLYSSIKILSSEIDEPIEDGRIVLDSLPFIDIDPITEEYVYILRLICDSFNTEYSELSHYQFKSQYSFSDSGDDFGLKRDIHQGKAFLELLQSKYSLETWRRSETDTSDETIYVSLEKSFGPNLGEESATLIEEILLNCNLFESDIDWITFFLTDESEDRRCRVIVRKTGNDESNESPYSCYAILMGGQALEYAQEIKQAFLSRDFFVNMGFYAQKAVITNAGRGISATVI